MATDFRMGEPLYIVGLQIDPTTHVVTPILMNGVYAGTEDGHIRLKMKNGTYELEDITCVYTCADDAMSKINALRKECNPEPKYDLQRMLQSTKWQIFFEMQDTPGEGTMVFMHKGKLSLPPFKPDSGLASLIEEIHSASLLKDNGEEIYKMFLCGRVRGGATFLAGVQFCIGTAHAKVPNPSFKADHAAQLIQKSLMLFTALTNNREFNEREQGGLEKMAKMLGQEVLDVYS